MCLGYFISFEKNLFYGTSAVADIDETPRDAVSFKAKGPFLILLCFTSSGLLGCIATLGRGNRGGLCDLDPDLSKSRGGHPESRDEKVQRNWPKKLGKVMDIPTLPDFRLKIGESWDWPRFIPNCLEISKSRVALPDPDPDMSKSRGGLPYLDLDLTRSDFGRDFIPLDISRTIVG